jgi:hypothetical protein
MQWIFRVTGCVPSWIVDCGLDLCGSGHGPEESSCEHVSESSESVKCLKSIAYSSDRRLPQKNPLVGYFQGKVIPVTGRGSPRGCETSRLSHFVDKRFIEGG